MSETASDRMETDRTGNGSRSVLHYYLQDELGSPLRVSGYDTDLHLGTETNTPYLTYGYDEFGNDLYDDLYNDMEEAGIPNPYSRQGKEQPFGYTGYRHDEISGTYFAQAREYQPQSGRFTAQDVIQGNGAYPETLNRYGYCLGNPVGLVDLDGMEPITQDKWETMTQEEWEAIAPNICHSFWATPEGLLSGQTELSIDSLSLRMSEKGKEVLKYYELGDKKTEWNENIVVANEATNKIEAVYPYYVGDGGITLGYGHYINYAAALEYPEEMKLLQKYINQDITSDIFDDGKGLGRKPRIVPDSVPIPVEELEEIFEADTLKMTENMLNSFDDRQLCLTIQQLDALILYRFQHGTLGPTITALVESGAPKEEWDKVITAQSTQRNQAVKLIYWGNIFDYEKVCLEDN